MKIDAAIITWCMTSFNFGETLQAYAMCSILRKYGYNPIVISYLQGDSRKQLRKNTIYKENVIGYISFWNFANKYMGPVYQCRSKEEVEFLTRKKSLLVCGSDQIWNPNYYEKDNIYTLGFDNSNKKKIAYAPSLTIENVNKTNEMHIRLMAKQIEKIDYISVREKRAAQILSNYMNNKIDVVLDPTLIISNNEWSKIADKGKERTDYIFVYVLGKIEKYKKLIEEICKRNNIKNIVWVDLIKGQSLDGQGVKAVRNISPTRFLSYIKNAKAVITDSFHGAMFSIKFNKEFWIIERDYGGIHKEGDVRLDDILSRLDLLERKISRKSQNIVLGEKIDYVSVNKKIKEEKRKSILFLDEALR